MCFRKPLNIIRNHWSEWKWPYDLSRSLDHFTINYLRNWALISFFLQHNIAQLWLRVISNILESEQFDRGWAAILFVRKCICFVCGVQQVITNFGRNRNIIASSTTGPQVDQRRSPNIIDSVWILAVWTVNSRYSEQLVIIAKVLQLKRAASLDTRKGGYVKNSVKISEII